MEVWAVTLDAAAVNDLEEVWTLTIVAVGRLNVMPALSPNLGYVR